MGESNQNDEVDWAVAVVHGVGTPVSGQTLEAVCSAIGCVKEDFQPAEIHTKTILNDEGAQLHTLHYTTNDSFVRIAEVFWGDISQLRGSAWDLIKALFTNLFGLRHICAAALQNANIFTRSLALVPFHLARLVILPLHLLSLITAIIIGSWLWLSTNGYIDGSTGYLTSNNSLFLGIAMPLTIISLLLALLWKFLDNQQSRYMAWDMALAVAFFAGLSTLLTTHEVQAWLGTCEKSVASQGLIDFTSYITHYLKSTPGYTFSEIACHLTVASTPIEDTVGIGKYIAINEFIGDAMFFISAGLGAILSILAIGYGLFAAKPLKRAVALSIVSIYIFVVVLAIVLEPIDYITRLVQSSFSQNYDFQVYWYEMLFPLWVGLAVIGGFLSYLYRVSWFSFWKFRNKKKDLKDSWGDRKNNPRILLPRFFEIFVSIGTIILIIVFMQYISLQKDFIALYQQPRLLLMTPVILAMVLLPYVFSSHLRFGLAASMDVLNHFFVNDKKFSVRDKISERFSWLVDFLLKEDDKPHLLVIAHSQGTVIAVDALLKDIWNKPLSEGGLPLKDRVDRMTVLTFGSPVTHIYQNYFYTQYPSFSETALKILADDPRIRWVNIYRVDDYVGTHIDGPIENFPENIPMPPGGHIRYWEEDVLLKLDDDLLPGTTKPASKQE